MKKTAKPHKPKATGIASVIIEEARASPESRPGTIDKEKPMETIYGTYESVPFNPSWAPQAMYDFFRVQREKIGRPSRDGVRLCETSDVTVQLSDELDMVVRNQEIDLACRSSEREAKKLRAITAAMDRLLEGIFGFCTGDDCEEPIHPRRLVAIPWTDLCIRCQEIDDRRKAGHHVDEAVLAENAA